MRAKGREGWIQWFIQQGHRVNEEKDSEFISGDDAEQGY